MQFVSVDMDLAVVFLSPVPLKIQTTHNPTCCSDAAFEVLRSEQKQILSLLLPLPLPPLQFVMFYGHLP